MSTKKRVTVAEYISQQLALSDKTQREIAEAIGYDRPNFITMIKQGQSKLPINKAPAMAKALGVDQTHFLRLVLQEYLPDVWNAVEEVMEGQGRVILTADEIAAVEIVRAESGAVPLGLEHPANREVLTAAVRQVAERERKEREAVRRMVDALPANSRHRRGG